MEERKTVDFKKKEFKVREYIKNALEKGKISKVRIEYTPVGEKIIVSTHKPGLVIGRKGEKINELTQTLKKGFKLENPSVEIDEIRQPEFDAQIIADDIALGLERFGPLRFKVIAYRTLQKIMSAGALGAEIILSGKLPGARAKSWRFAQGYLKKVGESAKVVDRAKAIAQTKPGTVGVKVSILSPYAILKDKININEESVKKLMQATKLPTSSKQSKDSSTKENSEEEPEKKVKSKSKKSSKKEIVEDIEKSGVSEEVAEKEEALDEKEQEEKE